MLERNTIVREKLKRAEIHSGDRSDWLVGQSSLTTFTYAVTDAVAIIASGFLSIQIVTDSLFVSSAQRIAMLLAVLLTWIVFNTGGLYSSWRGRAYSDHIRAVLLAWLSVFFLLLLSKYLVGSDILYDRSWFLYWAAIGLAIMLATRVSVMAGLRLVRKQGHNHKRIVVIGGGAWGRSVIQRIQAADWLGLDIAAVFDQDPNRHGQLIEDVPVRGDYASLVEYIATDMVDEVWICLPLGSHRMGGTDLIGDVMEILNDSTVTQRLIPEFEEMRLLDKPVSEIIGLPVISLNTSPLNGVSRIGKTVMDWVLASAILVVTSPVMLAIAIAIKIDSKGPVFFKQIRNGSDGKPFEMFKFRTMNGHIEENGTVTQATKNDPRVTKLGAFLRRNSLDELPQFLNVLQGSMSIVGPRPHAVEHNEYYRTKIDSYMQRHRVKPGITGWAQVNGFRGPTENIDRMRERVSHDLYYIEHWSLWLDVKIVSRTLLSGFGGENAY